MCRQLCSCAMSLWQHLRLNADAGNAHTQSNHTWTLLVFSHVKSTIPPQVRGFWYVMILLYWITTLWWCITGADCCRKKNQGPDRWRAVTWLRTPWQSSIYVGHETYWKMGWWSWRAQQNAQDMPRSFWKDWHWGFEFPKAPTADSNWWSYIPLMLD